MYILKSDLSFPDQPNYRMEALLLRGTFYLLTGNSKDALLDLNEVINNKDAKAKVWMIFYFIVKAFIYSFDFIFCDMI